MSVMNAILRKLGQQEIFLLETSYSTGGTDTSGIPAVKTLKQTEIPGILVPATEELLAELGLELHADSILFTTQKLSLDDEIYYNDILYEITSEHPAPLLYAGQNYSYMLSRAPLTMMDDPDYPAPTG